MKFPCRARVPAGHGRPDVRRDVLSVFAGVVGRAEIHPPCCLNGPKLFKGVNLNFIKLLVYFQKACMNKDNP